jgi:hypothetical protein
MLRVLGIPGRLQQLHLWKKLPRGVNLAGRASLYLSKIPTLWVFEADGGMVSKKTLEQPHSAGRINGVLRGAALLYGLGQVLKAFAFA